MAAMNQLSPFNQLISYFAAGAVGICATFAFDFFFEGGVETSLGGIGMLAILGGIVIALSEWMSWLVTKKWLKGVVFGLTIGLGAGILNSWFYGEGLLQSVIPWCVGGIAGGIIFKSFGPTFSKSPAAKRF